jgi:hypothetical protein
VNDHPASPQMFDAFSSDSRIVVFNPDIDLFDAGANNMPSAATFGMVAILAWLKRCEQDAAIQFFADTFPLQECEFGVIPLPKFTARGNFGGAIWPDQHGPDQWAGRPVRAMLGD